MEQYDAIFIGSGHNALIAAAYLARAGWSVLVLEKNDRPGGFVRTEELTLPGFKHDTFSSAHPLLLTGPAFAELGAELAQRGLQYANTDLGTGVSLADGRTAVLSTSMDANIAEAERLAPGDGAAWGQMFADFGARANLVFGLFNLDLASPPAREMIRQLMYGAGGTEFTPFAAAFVETARDYLQAQFRSEVMHAMLAPWALHLGRGPDEANSGFWVHLAAVAVQLAGMATPVGGSGMLAQALAQLIEDKGGTIRCQSLVERIRVKQGKADAVQTADGELYGARRAVVASTAPDQLYLKLLADSDVVPPLVRRQAGRFRYGRGCVQVQLALSEPPRWPDERLNRTGQPNLTTGLDGVSLAVNQAMNGLLPAYPTISFDTPSNLDPSRAPAGKAVARLQMLEVPTRPHGDASGQIDVGDGTWTDDLKNRFADRVIAIAGQHIPNLPGAILARHIIAPDDIARFNPNSGPGDPYGGSHDLAQSFLFRPLPAQPSHQTVVPNLYMLGAATWPGHGVSGGSGYIVAQQLLQVEG